jgi:hypothetical protein
MLILSSTTDALQVFTGNAGSIDVHASWMDNVSGAVQPGRTNTPTITTATTTTVVPSPAASIQRNLKTLHIRNRGTGPSDVGVIHTDGTTPVFLNRVSLPAGYTLEYVDEVGFLPVMAGLI